MSDSGQQNRSQDENVYRGQFLVLMDEWKSQTAHHSSTTEITMHPAYQRIIGLGMPAVPLILEQLQRKSDHWFWALRAITGDDPVPPTSRGRMREMAETWLRWGRERASAANLRTSNIL